MNHKYIRLPNIENDIEIKSISQLKQEILRFLDELKKCQFKSTRYSVFRKYRKSVYDAILKHTQFLDSYNVDFRTRVHCILNDITSIPHCMNCGKELTPKNWENVTCAYTILFC